MDSLFDQLHNSMSVIKLEEAEEVEAPDIDFVIFNREDKIPNLEKGDNHPELEKKKFWMLAPVFKENALGATLKWMIGLDIEKGEIVTRHGQVGGSEPQEERRKVELNNTGRNIEEQALIGIYNNYLKKYRKGYKVPGSEDIVRKEPMMANIYHEGKTRLNFPIGMTVKIDGIRCLIRLGGEEEEVIYRSRKNKDYKYISKVFDEDILELYKHLPPHVELDGEMYCDDLSFNEISSIFRKEVKTNYKLMKEHIKYHIFDHDGEGVYEERYSTLFKAFEKYYEWCEKEGRENQVVLLNTEYADNEEDMEDFYQWALDNKFEGIMLRKLGTVEGYNSSCYKAGKRVNNILKVKPIQDEEAEVVDVESARGRESGKAKLIVKDIRGNVFSTRPCATFEMREEWMRHPEKIIGKQVTIMFDSLSADGVPRFPRSKAFRDYE